MPKEGESSPDLSKVVSVIMEHPEIIEQISGLLGEGNGKSESAKEADAPPSEKSEEAAILTPRADARRSRLLYALKPYLSENRARAIDSMLTFGEIFDMMKKGK